MQYACLIVIVVVCVVNMQIGLVVATTPPPTTEPTLADCSDLNTHHLQPCAEGKVCVWNHCRCPGKSWCRLSCSNDPRKRCTGLHRGESCDVDVPSTCQKSRKLVCIPRVLVTTPETTTVP